jgi:hypothetical protein
MLLLLLRPSSSPRLWLFYYCPVLYDQRGTAKNKLSATTGQIAMEKIEVLQLAV